MNSSNSSNFPFLRSAIEADLNALVELENKVFAYDQLQRRSFKNFINSKNDLWVCEVNQIVVGYILVLKRKGSKKQRIYSLAISPECQGQGLGRILLSHVLKHTQGIETISLEVKVDNAGAIRLYESLGFIQSGRVAGFYSDGTDALIFSKSCK